MDDFVLSQVGLVGEAFAAFDAGVGLLTSVDDAVGDEVGLVGKRLATFRTHKWLLACVKYKMGI